MADDGSRTRANGTFSVIAGDADSRRRGAARAEARGFFRSADTEVSRYDQDRTA